MLFFVLEAQNGPVQILVIESIHSLHVDIFLADVFLVLDDLLKFGLCQNGRIHLNFVLPVNFVKVLESVLSTFFVCFLSMIFLGFTLLHHGYVNILFQKFFGCNLLGFIQFIKEFNCMMEVEFNILSFDSKDVL